MFCVPVFLSGILAVDVSGYRRRHRLAALLRSRWLLAGLLKLPRSLLHSLPPVQVEHWDPYLCLKAASLKFGPPRPPSWLLIQ